jgi:endo-alpha-1,4-polygalactosaminidase (GH114 family)
MPLRRTLAAAATITLVVAAPAAAGGRDDPRLTNAESWAFAIGGGQLAGDPEAVGERLGPFDLVVADGELARAGEVAELHERGATVLGYMSVGTIERWRGWYDRVKRFRLEPWKAWKDEWFADVSKPRLRRIITGRIAPRVMDKGFDGLFLDAVDMIEVRRHRPQRAGMRKLVRALAGLTHGQGDLLFAQNGFWGMRKFGIREFLDGWNREDVTTRYDFARRRYDRAPGKHRRAALRELARMRRAGLFTTAADYTKRPRGELYRDSIANACSVGALPFVSDLQLRARRLPDPPLTCSG